MGAGEPWGALPHPPPFLGVRHLVTGSGAHPEAGPVAGVSLPCSPSGGRRSPARGGCHICPLYDSVSDTPARRREGGPGAHSDSHGSPAPRQAPWTRPDAAGLGQGWPPSPAPRGPAGLLLPPPRGLVLQGSSVRPHIAPPSPRLPFLLLLRCHPLPVPGDSSTDQSTGARTNGDSDGSPCLQVRLSLHVPLSVFWAIRQTRNTEIQKVSTDVEWSDCKITYLFIF